MWSKVLLTDGLGFDPSSRSVAFENSAAAADWTLGTTMFEINLLPWSVQESTVA